MKKFAALALAGCMAVSLAACGGSASTSTAASESTAPAESTLLQSLLLSPQPRALPRPLRAVRSASASTSSTMPS